MFPSTQQSPALEDLEAFLRITEAKSLTAAAKRLRLPKSTLSRRLARLEQHLGAQLLVRTTRKLHLTETGSAYLERVAPALSRIEEATRAAREERDSPKGHVRMSAPFDLGTTWLPPLLNAFREKYPEITLEVLLEGRRVDLVGEGIDIALRAAAQLADSSLVARRIASAEIGLWASATYLKKRGTPKTVDDLKKHDVLVLGSPEKRLVLKRQATTNGEDEDGPASERSIDVRAALSSNEPSFLFEMALEDAGIAMVPGLCATGDTRLVRVLPGWIAGSTGLFVVHAASAVVPAKVRALRDFLAAHSPTASGCREVVAKRAGAKRAAKGG